ncbi:PH domain-containing protein [Chryseobacterium schmidteae]|uniref:PH domain-containing protein n=1 Tax=Chryseobacterium schmidteae TaxID=2730404 RepID=UPI0015887482|nr:PH domain-containing protein [Chryseobacterium schmidteae]
MNNLLNSSFRTANTTNILYTANKHWISLVIPTIFVLLGLVGIVFTSFGVGLLRLIGFGLLYLMYKGIVAILKYIYTKIYLTEEHLTVTYGILGKSVNDIPLNKLEAVILTQNFLGRILNFGTLTASTGDVTQAYVIKNPLELRSKIIK